MDVLRFHGLQYLRNRVVAHNDAVMFDIDDTLIYTDGRVNRPMLDLLFHAQMMGYHVVIITARPRFENVIEYTQNQLLAVGITWKDLGFCDPEQKGRLKKELGYNFVLSVGDMPTDLTDTQHFLDLGRMVHG